MEKKSSFIENYKKKVSNSHEDKIDDAIYHAFKLTDEYGIMRINKAILEASIKFGIEENILREHINNESFILKERKNNE